MRNLKSLTHFRLPRGLTLSWTFGFMLGCTLMFQIISGLLVRLIYSSLEGFRTSSDILYCTNWGWLARLAHANGASLFFLLIYLHLFRGLTQGSFKNSYVWNSGVTALIVLCMVSFLGYTLPWGQISFWGVSVITNLLSAIPIVGEELKILLWGNFYVKNSLASCFFRLHILLSFGLGALAGAHILLKHMIRPTRPLGLTCTFDKVPFTPYFLVKDGLIARLALTRLLYFTLYNPYLLLDPDNFFPAEPLVTPAHIKPEWYFLPAYAVLRSIPNKLGGVLGLAIAYAILYTLPYSRANISINSYERSPLRKLWSYLVATTWRLLTFLGGALVEYPYRDLALGLRSLYFCLILPLSL